MQSYVHEKANLITRIYDIKTDIHPLLVLIWRRYYKFKTAEVDTRMESCQQIDQKAVVTRHHHFCRFDCNRRHGCGNMIIDDANDIHQQQQRRSNLRAIMTSSSLIGILLSCLTYLLPSIVCNADNTTSPLLATLFMSAALTSIPITTIFLPLTSKTSNTKQGDQF